MNRIVIIGNGFDLAHGLPTKYENFINHLKYNYVNCILNDVRSGSISENRYFSLSRKIGSFDVKRFLCNRINELKTWDDIPDLVTLQYRSVDENGSGSNKESKSKIIFKNRLLSISNQKYKEKSWGGIENDYKLALGKILTDIHVSEVNIHASKLNSELKDIIDDLIIYLKAIPVPHEINTSIASKLYTKPLFVWRGSIDETNKLGSANIPNVNPDVHRIDNILFLNFNYTSTVNNYLINKEIDGKSIRDTIQAEWIPEDINTFVRYIHGDLSCIESNPIIFGYGDEQDEHQAILETMDNEFFKYIKSVQYTRTPYYREMIDFADADKFDIIIYGHSCSNTDRTLLNTLFEHNNCISIQPFLYDIGENSIYNNIYRCFKDKKLMRSRVVDQTNTISSLKG